MVSCWFRLNWSWIG